MYKIIKSLVSGSSLEIGGSKGENWFGKLYEIKLSKVFRTGSLVTWETGGKSVCRTLEEDF